MREYDKKLSELFVKFPSVQKAGFSSNAYKPGLERMLAFEEELSRPSSSFRTIHVAGTNGKGSVSSMLASALAATGLRVGLYTSPHLLDFRERMRMVGSSGVEMIPEEDVMDFIHEWEPVYERLDLSFFEITTGMAFWWFRKAGADIAVIEAGLGGRLDSTNIIRPELTVITSIGLDHCALLGDTREAIAREKAGIFKPGVPALIGIRDAKTEQVFLDRAAETGCTISFADEAPCPYESILPEMDLNGEYQAVNLRTAAAALSLLGISTDPEALKHTASRTGFRGRWEKIHAGPDMICDIGHNPPALRWNFSQLESYLTTGRYSRLIMVYGVMADKDLDGIMPLMPVNATYIYATPDTPRALPSDDILRRSRAWRESHGLPTDCLHAAGSVREALEMALGMAAEDDLIYVGGSTFVVADALKCEDLLKNSTKSLQNKI